MYNCIRMEFRKCFHSHNFIISMATCVLLALSSASYCCQGYLNIHDALDQYCFENGHMVSNELFPVWTSYNYWIGGESETLAYSAFYTLLPLFAILPHSLSCLQEKKSSYANQMIVRVGRQPYYLSKGIVCFFAAFITIKSAICWWTFFQITISRGGIKTWQILTLFTRSTRVLRCT